MNGHPKPIENLLTGLIDYAGLYPPASLDMRTAAGNYLRYRRGPHRAVLGRFIVSLDRLGELGQIAGGALSEMRLSVIVPPNADLRGLNQMLGDNISGASLEFKIPQSSEIERINSQLPANCEGYFEIPLGENEAFLDALAATGGRAKLRMGGVVADAFPAAGAVAATLHALAQRRIPFKATAGLHHPVRSRHPFTYQPESPSGTMHGFLNLAFAAAQLYFGGTADDALNTLEQQDAGAWRVEPDAIRCRGTAWSAGQLAEMRKEFFISFGSCSFEEPIRDLEVMRWL